MAMANSTKIAAVLLVFLQASCAVSWAGAYDPAVNVQATMTLNGFQEGEGGGGPAACDGQFHSDELNFVTLPTKWYAGGARCHNFIHITNNANGVRLLGTVIDECRGCDDEVGASANIWRLFNLDPSAGTELSISWSD